MTAPVINFMWISDYFNLFVRLFQNEDAEDAGHLGKSPGTGHVRERSRTGLDIRHRRSALGCNMCTGAHPTCALVQHNMCAGAHPLYLIYLFFRCYVMNDYS